MELFLASIKKMIYARIVMSLAPLAMVRQSTTVSNARATNFYLVASVWPTARTDTLKWTVIASSVALNVTTVLVSFIESNFFGGEEVFGKYLLSFFTVHCLSSNFS